MSYLTCFFSIVIAVASFCTADEDELLEEECASVGMPRATLMSAISGIAGIPGIAAPSIYQARQS